TALSCEYGGKWPPGSCARHRKIRSALTRQERPPPGGSRWCSDLVLGRQDLAIPVRAGLEVDVMRPSDVAGLLILDEGRGGNCIGRTAVAALHPRHFLPGNGH